jgi:hypothetical protein
MLLATTAVQGYALFESVRIREVEVWHCPMASTTSVVLVEFGGQNAGLVGDQQVHQDSSMGVQPAHVRARPARLSQAAQWQYESTTAAFRLLAPTGAVVDVELEGRGEFNSANAVSFALVGATPGALYLRGLDGQPVASSVLLPAVPTTWIR